MTEQFSSDKPLVDLDCIILYGALRSGTTMLRLMLDAHPALSCPGESDFLFDHLQACDGSWRYDFAGLDMDRIYRASPMHMPEDADGTAALAQMIAQVAQRKPGSRPVLVLHRHAEKALSILPNAQVIHLLRDPRDVARSVIGMGWAGNVFHGLEPWIETEDQWIEAQSKRQCVVHELRYEQLVTEPENTLDTLCAFLGLTYDAAMLAYDTHSTYGKPDPKLTYQWRHKLAARQIRQLEARLSSRLERANYTPSGLPPLKISAAELFWLRVQNMASTKIHSIRRYGFGNILQRKVARIAGLRRWEARTQARIDQITVRYLK